MKNASRTTRRSSKSDRSLSARTAKPASTPIALEPTTAFERLPLPVSTGYVVVITYEDGRRIFDRFIGAEGPDNSASSDAQRFLSTYCSDIETDELGKRFRRDAFEVSGIDFTGRMLTAPGQERVAKPEAVATTAAPEGAVVIVPRADDWKPRSTNEVPPDFEVHFEQLPRLVALGFNEAELKSPSGFWAVPLELSMSKREGRPQVG